MNVPCSLIEDLLPLYYDEACSQESRTWVEEHLQKCAACRRKLADLREEMEHPKEDQTELLSLHAALRVLIRRKRKIFLKGAFLTILIVLVMASPMWLTLTKNQPVPAEDIEIDQVCQLSDGGIVFHLYVDDGKVLENIDFEVNHNCLYLTPKHSILEEKRREDKGFCNTYFAIYLLGEQEHIPQEERVAFSGICTDIEALYIGVPGDAVPIWKKGTPIPKASRAMEKMMRECYKDPFMYPEGKGLDWDQYYADLERVLGDEMFRKEEDVS